MEKKKVLRLFQALFFLIIILSLFLLLVNRAQFTGFVGSDVAIGGQITNLNLTMPRYWEGYYGNLGDLNDPITIEIEGDNGDVEWLDLGLKQCYTTELYVTNGTDHLNTSSNPSLPSTAYMNSLVYGSPADFDNSFGFSNYLQSMIAGNVSTVNTFNETKTFEVGDNTLNLNGTQLNSSSGEYNVGLLVDPFGNFVFVFSIVNGIGFTGENADYELMVPVHYGENETYYFFQDVTDNGCNFGGVSAVPSEEEFIYNNGGGVNYTKEVILEEPKNITKEPISALGLPSKEEEKPFYSLNILISLIILLGIGILGFIITSNILNKIKIEESKRVVLQILKKSD